MYLWKQGGSFYEDAFIFESPNYTDYYLDNEGVEKWAYFKAFICRFLKCHFKNSWMQGSKM